MTSVGLDGSGDKTAILKRMIRLARRGARLPRRSGSISAPREARSSDVQARWKRGWDRLLESHKPRFQDPRSSITRARGRITGARERSIWARGRVRPGRGRFTRARGRRSGRGDVPGRLSWVTPGRAAIAAPTSRPSRGRGKHRVWERLQGGALYAATARVDWATRLRRSFAVDVLECPKCHGRLRVIAGWSTRSPGRQGDGHRRGRGVLVACQRRRESRWSCGTAEAHLCRRVPAHAHRRCAIGARVPHPK